MTERKKRIIALSLASTMLIALTGCKKQKEYNVATKKATIEKNIDNYYVVVLSTNDQYKVFLTNNIEEKYISIDDNEIIVVKNKDNTNVSELGSVSGVYPFCLYFSDYQKGKCYSEEKINQVFDMIEDNYETRNKKLTLN